MASQAQQSGSVVDPGLLHADVSAEGGQRAVAGLVGDGAVGGAAQVGVRDEPGPETVGGVVGGVQAGAGDGGLDEGVDRAGVEGSCAGAVVLADAAKDGAVDDARKGQPLLQGGDGAAVAVGGPGEDDKFGSLAGLVGLGPKQGQDKPVDVVVDIVDGSRAASSLRRRAATKPTSSRARSRVPARSGSGERPLVFQVLVTGQASSTSNNSGGMRGCGLLGGVSLCLTSSCDRQAGRDSGRTWPVGSLVAQHGEQDIDTTAGQADQGSVVTAAVGPFAVVVGATVRVRQRGER